MIYVYTLWGVLGTFLGGLGGVETSFEREVSVCPKTEGELGPEFSVLNLSIFLLGLMGELAHPLEPAGEEKQLKSAPKSSDFNNLEYASLFPPPPSFTGDAFSTRPKVCSLEEDLQGMNLSLQLADLEDGDDDRFDIVRGDLFDIGDEAKLVVRFDLGGEEKASRRREVSDIVDGRLIPLFLL